MLQISRGATTSETLVGNMAVEFRTQQTIQNSSAAKLLEAYVRETGKQL